MPATLAPPAESRALQQRAQALDLYLRQLRDSSPDSGAVSDSRDIDTTEDVDIGTDSAEDVN